MNAVNIDVDLNKVTDILGDRIKSLELENALLKAALNEATDQIGQEQIQRLEEMAIPLPQPVFPGGAPGPNMHYYDGSTMAGPNGFDAVGSEKTGWFPDPGMPRPSSVVEATDCVEPR